MLNFVWASFTFRICYNIKMYDETKYENSIKRFNLFDYATTHEMRLSIPSLVYNASAMTSSTKVVFALKVKSARNAV